mmetsp:Transcript_25825/g.58215  ORF Transcript_25825/g.58215 Transcript_25825/m.58215 type:complete len:292 (+) Transcript_25825:2021-2896(+)
MASDALRPIRPSVRARFLMGPLFSVSLPRLRLYAPSWLLLSHSSFSRDRWSSDAGAAALSGDASPPLPPPPSDVLTTGAVLAEWTLAPILPGLPPPDGFIPPRLPSMPSPGPHSSRLRRRASLSPWGSSTSSPREAREDLRASLRASFRASLSRAAVRAGLASTSAKRAGADAASASSAAISSSQPVLSPIISWSTGMSHVLSDDESTLRALDLRLELSSAGVVGVWGRPAGWACLLLPFFSFPLLFFWMRLLMGRSDVSVSTSSGSAIWLSRLLWALILALKMFACISAV